MTERILNSLFIRNMFIYMTKEQIVDALVNKKDKEKFLDGIIDIFNSTLFFNIDSYCNESLIFVLSHIRDSESWDKEFINDINRVIEKAREIVFVNEETKDFNNISYGSGEARKRKLHTGSICVPSHNQIEPYLYSDYVIIKSLVENNVFPEDVNVDQILSAISLIVTTHIAVLFENPHIEVTIYNYLYGLDIDTVKGKIKNRKEIKRIRQIIEELRQFDERKELAYEVNRELTSDGYTLVKDRQIKNSN